jgi:hypothetical protein
MVDRTMGVAPGEVVFIQKVKKAKNSKRVLPCTAHGVGERAAARLQRQRPRPGSAPPHPAFGGSASDPQTKWHGQFVAIITYRIFSYPQTTFTVQNLLFSAISRR